MLLYTCGTLSVLHDIAQNPSQNPTLAALIQLLDLPNYSRYCNSNTNLPK
jgi:hypothetical protein